MRPSDRFSGLLTLSALQTVAVGAIAGFLAFILGERFLNTAPADFYESIRQTAVWSGVIGLVLGAILLARDNAASLRGVWHRDLPLGLPLFYALGAAGGAIGQIFYSESGQVFGDFFGNFSSLFRAGGWALLGAGVGIGVGALRRDMVQATRGGWGGILGGFVGGFVFNSLAVSVGPDDSGVLPRAVGLTILGASIAFGRLLVQETLKTAWVLGISTGPYEGKEAPLTKNRVTVGRDTSNDIALFRDESVPPHLGAFLFENGVWKWSGGQVKLDGVETTQAVLTPESIIEFGAARFRFLDRSRQNPLPSSLLSSPQGTSQGKIDSSVPVSASFAFALHPTEVEAPWPVLQLENGQNEASIGRAPTSDFVVSHATVSSNHARLFRTGRGLQLRDEHSTNGTSLNGQKIEAGKPVLLREGDRVKLGQIEFMVRR